MPVTNGKLKPDDERRLRQNYKALADEIDGKYYLAELFSRKIFTLDDKEEISNLTTRLLRTEKMLDKLFYSGPLAYDVFVKILEAQNKDLADQLKNTVLEDSPASSLKPDYSWIDALPDSVKTHMITDADASQISRSFGKNWQLVLLRLGISDSKIDLERQNYPHSSVIVITTNLLIKWRQQIYKKATVSAILSVLREVDQDGTSNIDWDIVRNFVSKMYEKKPETTV